MTGLGESRLTSQLKRPFVTSAVASACTQPDGEAGLPEVDSFQAWRMAEVTNLAAFGPKKGMLRASFDTPEARHNFCLSAFRPSSSFDGSDTQSEVSEASSESQDMETRAISIRPRLNVTNEAGKYNLERTDKPVSIFGLPQEFGSSSSLSNQEDSAQESTAERQTELPFKGSLKVNELWTNVPTQKCLNPFEGFANDAGFFGKALP